MRWKDLVGMQNLNMGYVGIPQSFGLSKISSSLDKRSQGAERFSALEEGVL